MVGFAPEARGSDACCLVGRKQQGEIGLPQASHLQMGRSWNIYGISMEYLWNIYLSCWIMGLPCRSWFWTFFSHEFRQRSQKFNWCETPGAPIDSDPACPCSMLLDSNEKYHKPQIHNHNHFICCSFPNLKVSIGFFGFPFHPVVKQDGTRKRGIRLNDSCQHALFAHLRQWDSWVEIAFWECEKPNTPKNHQKCIILYEAKVEVKNVLRCPHEHVQRCPADWWLHGVLLSWTILCCGNRITLGISIQTISDTTMARRQRHQQHQAVSWRWSGCWYPTWPIPMSFRFWSSLSPAFNAESRLFHHRIIWFSTKSHL